jgi:hypothetical protein
MLLEQLVLNLQNRGQQVARPGDGQIWTGGALAAPIQGRC